MILLISFRCWIPRQQFVNTITYVERHITIIFRGYVPLCGVDLVNSNLLIQEALRHDPWNVRLVLLIETKKNDVSDCELTQPSLKQALEKIRMEKRISTDQANSDKKRAKITHCLLFCIHPLINALEGS